MSKLNFQHHYSSLQCHMILQKILLICWLVAQETFLMFIPVEDIKSICWNTADLRLCSLTCFKNINCRMRKYSCDCSTCDLQTYVTIVTCRSLWIWCNPVRLFLTLIHVPWVHLPWYRGNTMCFWTHTDTWLCIYFSCFSTFYRVFVCMCLCMFSSHPSFSIGPSVNWGETVIGPCNLWSVCVSSGSNTPSSLNIPALYTHIYMHNAWASSL